MVLKLIPIGISNTNKNRVGFGVYLKDGCDCDHTVTVKVLHRDLEDDSVIFISVQHHQNISK